MEQFFTPNNAQQNRLRYFLIGVISLIFVLGLLITPAAATGVYDLPTLNAGESVWIIDQAEALSLATEGKLNNDLQKLSENTGNELRLVAIRRLDFDETIDTLANKIFTLWYPTPEAQANQVLLVMDTLTKRTAIRTGEALKPLLSDEIAESITSTTVAFPLRNGSQYNQAFLDGTSRLVTILSGQPDPGPPIAQQINTEGTFTSAAETNDQSATLWVIVFLVVATVVPMVTYFWYVGFPGR